MDNKKATLELGTKPVKQLLRQYATPAIIAMTASSLYNMADSIFIGQGVNATAISGLAITFPFMNLSAAFGAAVGIGSSTLISMRLGQKDYSTANRILGNNVSLNVIIGLLLMVVCLIFINPILRFFGASDATLPYAREYMEIILLGNVFTHLYFGMNAVLRAASKPRQAMYATMFTVMLNIILDPIFIWVFDMGIRGAALATILSQMAALTWQFRLLSNKREFLHFQKHSFKIDTGLVKNIIAIGISPFSMNTCACLVVIFINNQLVHYGGDSAVGAYGISNRLAFIFFMIVMGINQGMQPIAGYNYGAQQMDRVFTVLKYSVIYATLAMTAGWVVSVFFPWPCARLFTNDPDLLRESVNAIRINMLVSPLIGSQAVITNFFQSIGKAKVSVFLSLSRQMLFLIPLAAIMPIMWGINGVWAALPASDLVAFIITIIILIRYLRNIRTQNLNGYNDNNSRQTTR